MEKINAADKNIIAQLYKNGRAPYTELAKAARVSKEVANYRLKRMLQQGIVTKFTPVIDFGAIGLQTYRIQLKLHSVPKEFEDRLLEKCHALPHITWVVDLSGGWDLVLLFACRKTSEFTKSLKHTSALFGQLIQEKQVSIITGIFHYAPTSLIDAKIHPIVTDESVLENKLHENEQKILLELLKDGRMSILDIAKNLNMSATNATHHLKQLKTKGILKGIRPMLNYGAFKLDHFKVMLSLRDPSLVKTCYEFIHQHLDIIYITESIGKYDVEFEAVAHSYRELLFEIEKIKEHVDLLSYEVILTQKERLISMFPKD